MLLRTMILVLPFLFACGCGSNETKLPGALTEEQKKAIKAEDDKVAEEEGGKNGKNRKGKK